MPKRDLSNQITPVIALAPVAVALADNTAQGCAIQDHKGFDSITYVIATGTLADAGATFTALLEHGDASNLSDAAAVPDSQLVGTEALATFDQSADSKCFKLGYRGGKRYSRLTITPAGNAGNAPLAVVCLKGHPHVTPTANPPA